MTFSRLVRYESDGQVHYGELLDQSETGSKVKKLNGSLDRGFEDSGEEATVVKTVGTSSAKREFHFQCKY
jgi:hypothetical protein